MTTAGSGRFCFGAPQPFVFPVLYVFSHYYLIYPLLIVHCGEGGRGTVMWWSYKTCGVERAYE
jgi:hypothetical protein